MSGAMPSLDEIARAINPTHSVASPKCQDQTVQAARRVRDLFAAHATTASKPKEKNDE